MLTGEMAIKTRHLIDLDGVFRRSGTACKLPCHRNGPRFDARPAKRTGLSFFIFSSACGLLPLMRAFQAHEVTAIRNGDQVVVLQFPQASNTVWSVVMSTASMSFTSSAQVLPLSSKWPMRTLPSSAVKMQVEVIVGHIVGERICRPIWAIVAAVLVLCLHHKSACQ